MENAVHDLSAAIEDTPHAVKQFVLTPAAGKRLIARALALHPVIQKALKSAVIVIIAGTTNGYIAEEILSTLDGCAGFTRSRFVRGVTLPPKSVVTSTGRLPDESAFPGDVVLHKGVWNKGQTIFDVVDSLQEGDIVLKGANALDWAQKRAAVLIGHPKGGTIGAALQAVLGRRVQLILPVGLEKRVLGDLDDLANLLNTPGAEGPRLWPVSGLVFTEIEAIGSLTGARADLIAAGGICGAEGSIRLAIRGTGAQLDQAEALLQSVASELPFEL